MACTTYINTSTTAITLSDPSARPSLLSSVRSLSSRYVSLENLRSHPHSCRQSLRTASLDGGRYSYRSSNLQRESATQPCVKGHSSPELIVQDKAEQATSVSSAAVSPSNLDGANDLGPLPRRRDSRLQSPDRFLLPRRSLDSASDRLRVSKSPEQLTPSQRLARRRTPSTDAFTGRRISASNYHQRAHMTRPAMTIRDSLARSATQSLMRSRAVSAGGVWQVGGVPAVPMTPLAGVPDGRGGLLGSGTNAPMFSSNFFATETIDQSTERFEGRLAAALDLDQCSKVLQDPLAARSSSPGSPKSAEGCTMWSDNAWQSARVLDAPSLRDDFYCSVLAHCSHSRTLAVGLNNRVYLWSEGAGVTYPTRAEDSMRGIYVTSLAFSSPRGQQSILATGRSNGKLSLWSLQDEADRFHLHHSDAISCLAFKPVPTRRPSTRLPGLMMPIEELLVGSMQGQIYCYAIEWDQGTGGSTQLVARLDMHSQQVCGLAWSQEGDHFATGGNDNSCFLFASDDVFGPSSALPPFDLRPTPAPGLFEGSFPPHSLPDSDLSFSDPHGLLPPMAGLIPHFVPNAASHHTLRSMLDQSHQRPSTSSPSPIQPPSDTISDLQLPSDDIAQLHRPHRRHRRLLTGIRTAQTATARPPPIMLQHPRSLVTRSPHPDAQAALRSMEARSPLMAMQFPRILTVGAERHRWIHSAAVKAIAFCPWQRGLIATGGGSNDRAIHFFHAWSGACLATINVQAQVTSLIWSRTRREIAATFGYAQPDHPYRIAVFSWPDCRQVVAIPWAGDMRALYAIPYPGGPNDNPHGRDTGHGRDATDSPRRRSEVGEGGRWWHRTAEEGCIVVASSDESVKFHEVWSGSGSSKGVRNGVGGLGWSSILESEEGVDRDWGEVIR